jgi:hypothetical protein
MAHKQKAAIRRAVTCREYEKATRLWSEYIGHLRERCKRGALTRAEMEEVRELFDWARVTMQCQRAHLQQRLRGLQVAALYGQPAPSENRRILQTRA